MVSRLFSLLCWQLAGGLAGWWLGDPQVGLVGGAMVWLAVDSMRGARVLTVVAARRRDRHALRSAASGAR